MWSCSSGVNQHSVCIRSCLGDFQSESIKCKCKQHICQWVRKGNSCTRTEHSNKANEEFDSQSSQEISSDIQLEENQDDSIKSETILGENFFGQFDLDQGDTEQGLGGPGAPRELTVGSGNFGKIIFKGDVVFNMNYNL